MIKPTHSSSHSESNQSIVSPIVHTLVRSGLKWFSLVLFSSDDCFCFSVGHQLLFFWSQKITYTQLKEIAKFTSEKSFAHLPRVDTNTFLFVEKRPDTMTQMISPPRVIGRKKKKIRVKRALSVKHYGCSRSNHLSILLSTLFLSKVSNNIVNLTVKSHDIDANILQYILLAK